MANDRPAAMYLIRHEETAWNKEWRCQRVTDIPLTETANLIAKPHWVSPECHAELTEWDQGKLKGLTAPELMRDLQERAWSIIDGLRQQALSGLVAIVRHTLTTAVILCAALGLELAKVHRLKIDLASISRLIFTEFGPFAVWRLAALNDRHHLSAN